MNVKGRAKNFAPSALILIMAIAAFITVPIRTYQLMNIIEPQTGFYTKYDISITILYALIAVACLLIFIFSYVCGSIPKPEFPEKKNNYIGVVSVLFSLSFIWDSIVQINRITHIFRSEFGATAVDLSYYIKTGFITTFIQSVFAILSAVYFAIFAVSYLKGKKIYSSQRLSALSPIVWGICRIVQRFVEPISFKNVSELLIQLFMLVFMLIFLLSFARIASNVNPEKSYWLLYASGLSACLFALISVLPSLILTIMGKSSLLYVKFPFSYCDIFFAIFVVVLLIEFMPTKSKIEQNNNTNIKISEDNKEVG